MFSAHAFEVGLSLVDRVEETANYSIEGSDEKAHLQSHLFSKEDFSIDMVRVSRRLFVSGTTCKHLERWSWNHVCFDANLHGYFWLPPF